MVKEKSNNKLRKNMLSSSMYQVFVLIVPILTTPYVTRIFSVNQMGEYSLSLTLSSLFVVISQFGLQNYGSREIAVSKSPSESNIKFFNLESMQVITSIISFALYNILFLVILNIENKMLFFSQSFLIIANIFDISWFYIGIEEIDKVIIRNGITKLLTTMLVFVLINESDQLILYALINVLGMFIGNLTMVIQSSKYIDYSAANFKLNKSNFRESFTLLIPVLANSSFDSIEKSLLSIRTSSTNVGIYSESKKIINLVAAIINSSFNALSPRMSYFVSMGQEEKMKKYFEKALSGSVIFSIVIIAGIYNVADSFVDFFYGNGYELVANVLQVSSISLFFIPISVLICKGLLIPFGKDKEYTYSILIVLVSGIIFNMLLDLKYGAIGAGVAFVISQFFSFMYVMYTVKDFISVKKTLFQFAFSIVAVIINILFLKLFVNYISFENSFIAFVIYGIISVLISFILVIPLYLINFSKYKFFR